MSYLNALILGLLQGITEFLPISSSGHLILAEKFLGLNVAGLKSFDVFVHMGTFFAIAIYFWKDIGEMIAAVVLFRKNSLYLRLVFYIILATVPAVILGAAAGDLIDNFFRDAHSVAVVLLIVGVIFLVAEWVYGKYFSESTRKSLENVGWRRALIIGAAQAVALIPGVSRSGATISAGLFQGVRREEAAKFSFLLGLPAILGAATLTAVKVSGGELASVGRAAILIGFFSAFVSGFICIYFLLKFLKSHSLAVFAAYRIALAGGILMLF